MFNMELLCFLFTFKLKNVRLISEIYYQLGVRI